MGYLKERHGMMMLGKHRKEHARCVQLLTTRHFPITGIVWHISTNFMMKMDVGQRGVTLWLIAQRK